MSKNGACKNCGTRTSPPAVVKEEDNGRPRSKAARVDLAIKLCDKMMIPTDESPERKEWNPAL